VTRSPHLLRLCLLRCYCCCSLLPCLCLSLHHLLLPCLCLRLHQPLLRLQQLQLLCLCEASCNDLRSCLPLYRRC
jgi:hypothetical protein